MNEYYDEDFADDAFPPEAVMEHIKVHDEKMSSEAKVWALAKSMYMTRYWKHVRALRDGEVDGDSLLADGTDVEVNRMWPFVSSYISALYPRANRVVVGSDPSGKGNPQLAQAVSNQWLASNRVHRRIVGALRQAILFPGVGVKLGHASGSGSALSRVWMRVIPWWEMILDHDVKDHEDERFRGHIYYKPKSDVETEYGVEDLKGCSREDFLDTSGTTESKGASVRDDVADTDKDAFVRVVEFCNLVDSVKVGGESYKGRLEIYILDQGDSKYKKPIHVGPLPFSAPDGEGTPHILPLVFNSEPDFPLRGIAHSERVMPQFRELNHYRTFYAQASRRDTRQYVTKRGYFDADQLSDLTEGMDGLILEVTDQEYDGPLDQALVPIHNAPLSSNIHKWTDFVEHDIEMAIGISPNVRGSITKATAEEVRNTQYYTESEFGLHAMLKDQWLADLIQLLLRVLISAMQTVEDSTGGFETEDVAVDSAVTDETPVEGDADSAFPFDETEEDSDEDTEESPSPVSEDSEEDTEEETAEPEEPEESDEDAEFMDASGKLDQIAAALTGKPIPEVDDDSKPPLGVDKAGGSLTIKSETLYVKISDQVFEVSVDDLDADFEIEFVEGGRTPLADQQSRAHLVELSELYFALWDKVNGSDHGSVLAEAYMRVLADKFDLPRDLHPDQLMSALKNAKESGKVKEKREQPQPQPGQPPQQPQPQQPVTPEQVAQLPAEQLAQIIMDISEDPQVAQALLQKAAQLPEKDQQPFLASIVIEAMQK